MRFWSLPWKKRSHAKAKGKNRRKLKERSMRIEGLEERQLLSIVSISAPDSAAGELSNPGLYRISRDAADSEPLTVKFQLGGSASYTSEIWSNDYAFSSNVYVASEYDYSTYSYVYRGTVTIASGQTSVDFDLLPVNDSQMESSESVQLSLVESGGGGCCCGGSSYSIGSPSSASVTISDNDQWSVAFEVLDASAAEVSSGSPNPGQVRITRSGETDTSHSLAVTFQLGGSAAYSSESWSTDYTLSSNASVSYEYDYSTSSYVYRGTVTIAAGQTTALVDVNPVDDSAVESQESATLSLVTSGGCCGGSSYSIGSPSTATVTITDNDTLPTVSITATDDTATEAGPTTGQFTVTRTGSTASPLTVYYSLATGTGKASYSDDFSGLPNFDSYYSTGYVTIGAGSSTALITITPVDDQTVESDEQVSLTLASGGGCCGGSPYSIGSPSAATVTITDNDTLPTVSITTNDDAATEAGPTTGQFTVTRTGSTASPLTVYYSLATGTGKASYSDDFSGLPNFDSYYSTGYVTIGAGSSTALITITPVDDQTVESDEQVSLTLASGGGCCGGSPYSIGSPSAATVTITDNDSTNQPPTLDTISNASVNEDAAQQTVSLTGITAGGESQSLAVTATTDNATLISSLSVSYTSPASTGTLYYTPAANLWGTATITVTVRDAGSDGQLNNADDGITTRSFTVTVAEVNDAPSFTGGGNPSAVNEDAGPQTVTAWATNISVGPANESSQTATFQIVSNSNASLFSAGPAIAANGTLTYTPAANAYGAATISVRLSDNGGTANGGQDTSSDQSFTITVNPVNDPPTASDLQQTLAEGSASGTVVGTVSASDPDSGQTLSYAITAGNGAGAFAIDSATGQVTVANGTLLDYETSQVWTLTVTVSDNAEPSLSDTATVTINLSDVNEAAPVAADDSFTVAENSAAGTIVGTVSASDADTAQTLSYAITGGTGQGLFAINSTTGQITVAQGAAIDYETQSSYGLTVTVSDNGSPVLSDTAAITINLGNVNEAPSATSTSFQVAEQSANGTLVGTVTASDPDVGTTLSYAITAGDASGRFAIDSSTGQITVAQGTLLDYETQASYGLTVTVSDSGDPALSGTATITVTLSDVNEAPQAQDATFQVAEQSANGTVVGTVTASDQDSGQTLSYAITAGDASGVFAINTATGQITVAQGNLLDEEVTATYTLTVTVTDSASPSLSDTASITVNVLDANDPPVADDATFQTPERSANGTIVGTVTASDPDSGQTLSYSITAGDPSGAFAINGTTGQLTVANGSLLSYAGQPTYTLTVRVQDNGLPSALWDDATITVNLSDVNDAPSFTKGADQGVLEDAGAQTVSAWASAILAGPANESGQTLTFLVSTSNDSLFSVLPAIDTSGNLTYTPAANAFGTATVTVQLQDSGGTAGGGQDTSASQTFTISVTAVNDAPSFTAGGDPTAVNEDAGAQTVSAWATGMSAGPTNEAAQTMAFEVVSNSNPGLFAAGPAIDAATGNLTYTPAANAYGTATITVRLVDDGGTANGGVNQSAEVQFTITVSAQPDLPVVSNGSQSLLEDGTLSLTATDFTGAFSDADGDSLQKIQITALPTHGILKLSGDAVAVNQEILASALGNLTYQPDANYFGSDSLQWNGYDGTAYAATAAVLSISVTGVNDAPSFTGGGDPAAVNEDAGAQAVSGWATGMSAGPSNESGQVLSFAITANSNSALFSAGPAIDAAAGNLSYTPAANAHGTATITVRLMDDGGTANGGANASTEQTFTITVNSVNDAPTVAASSKSLLEDATLALAAADFTGAFGDVDGDSLQKIQITALPTHGTLRLSGDTVTLDQEILSSALGNLTYQPDADYFGSGSLQWNGFDGATYAATAAALSIQVAGVNDAPSFTPGANQAVAEDAGAQAVSGWATAMSAGPGESSQTLSFQITFNTNPDLFSGAPSIDAITGDLAYIPAANAHGTATITVRLADNGGVDNGGQNTSAEQTFTITVNSVNDAPTVANSSKSLLEDATLGFAAADFSGAFADIDGDSLTAVKIVTLPAHGTLTCSGSAVAVDQVITLANLTNLLYQPAANYNGSDSFTWTGSDGTVYAATAATLTFSITAVNDAPSFTAGSNQSVDEDSATQSVTGWATAISAGPADEASQLKGFQVVSNSNPALFATLPALTATGTLSYRPAHNANGTATIGVVLFDSGGTANGGVNASATSYFTITINSVNDLPVARSSGKVALEDQALGFTATDFEGQFSDVDTLDVLEAVKITALPTHGTLWLSNEAVEVDDVIPVESLSGLSYQPTADYRGFDSLTWLPSDGTAYAAASATLTIRVDPVNDAPTFTAQGNVSANEDSGPQTFAGWITTTETGPANETGQTLSFTVTSNSSPSLFAAGPVVDAATGNLSFTPAADACGTAVIHLVLVDNGGTANGGQDTSVEYEFTITLNPQNDRPIATGASVTVTEDAPLVFLLGDDGDPQEQTLVLNVTSEPARGTLSFNGTTGEVTYTPAADYVGTDSFSYTLTDDNSIGDPLTSDPVATVSITVVAVNDPPTLDAIADPAAIDEDAVQQTVSLTGISAGGGESQDLRVTAASANTALIATVSVSYTSADTTGSLSYTPVANASGTALITVTVADAGLDGLFDTSDDGSTTRQFTVTVNPTNDAPTVTGSTKNVLEDGSLAFAAADFEGQFADIDAGDALQSVKILTLPTHGTLKLSGVDVTQNQVLVAADWANLSYQPVPDYNGADGFTWTGSDGEAEAAQAATLSILVQSVNDAPSFTGGGDPTPVAEDAGEQVLTGWAPVISAGPTNESAQAVSFEVQSNSNPGLFAVLPAVSSAGTLSFTPAAGANGTAQVSLVLVDNGGTAGGGSNNSTAYQFTITVTAANDQPLANAQSIILDQGAATSITLAGDDADPEATQVLTYAIASNPSHGTLSGFNAGTGAVVYTPDSGYYGPDSFTFTVTDDNTAGGDGLTSAAATVSLAVANPPTLDSITDPAAIAEDAGVQTVSLTGISAGTGESQAISVTAASNNSALIPAVSVSYTSADSTGSLSYTPAANQSGTALITVTVRDAGADGTLDTADDRTLVRQFTVTVSAANDAPTAAGQTPTTLEDTPLALVLTGSDEDPELVQALTFALVDGPSHGTLSGFSATTGEVLYTPAADYAGTDSFTFTVTDDNTAGGDALTSTTATVTITVGSVNDPPTLDSLADPAAIDEDAAEQIVSLSGISAGGGESQLLRVTASSSNTALVPTPSVSYTSAEATGSLAYTPVTNQSGTAVISVTVTDAGPDGLWDTADDASIVRQFTVTVTAINDAPAISNSNKTATEDQSLALAAADFTGYWTDADPADSLQAVKITALPAHGTLVLSTVTVVLDQVIALADLDDLVYQPAADYNGPDSFTWTGSDGTAYAATSATLSVSIAAVNDTPTADEQNVALDEDGSLAITLSGSDSDPEVAQALTYAVLSPPLHGRITGFDPATGQLLYTPEAEYAGTDSFTFLVIDDSKAGAPAATASQPATVSITVNAVNDAPVAFSLTLTATEGQPLGILVGEDGDPEVVQGLTFQLLTGPTFGGIDYNAGNGQVVYLPSTNTSDIDTIEFTLTDSGGLVSAHGILSIHITAVNSTPVASSQTISIEHDVPVSLVLAGDDGDVELNQTLTYAVVSMPSHGNLSGFDPATGEATYTPLPGYSGTDSFSFTVTDNGSPAATSSVATISISVGASTDVPRAEAGELYLTDDVSVLELDGSASYDPSQEADTLLYAWDLDGDGQFGETGAEALRGDETGVRPVFSALGLDGPTSVTVTLRVTDASGLSDTDSATVRILAAAPHVSIVSPGVPGSVFATTGTFTDSGEGPWLAWVDYGDHSGMQVLTLSADKSFALAHTYAETGFYNVLVQIQDPDGQFGEGTLEVTVGSPAPEVMLRTPVGDEVSGPFDLGTIPLRVATEVSFWLCNTGTRPLSIDPESLILPAGVRLLGSLPEAIDSGGQSLLAFEVTPEEDGPFSGTVSFGTNDIDEDPCTITLTADVLMPTGAPHIDGFRLKRDTGTSTTDHVTANPVLLGLVTGDFAGGRAVLQFDHDADHQAIWHTIDVDRTVTQFEYDPRLAEPALAGYVGPLSVYYRLLHYDAVNALVDAGPWTQFDLTMETARGSSYSVTEVGLSSDTGPSSWDNITSDPTIEGNVGFTYNNTGILVQIEAGGAIDGTAPIARGGDFSYRPRGLAYGVETPIRVRAMEWDTQSDCYVFGAWTDPLLVTLQQDRPPAIAQLTLANDTGPNTADNSTADPTLRGSIADSDVLGGIQVDFYPAQGETPMGSTWTDANGHFTYRPRGLGASGQKTLWARTSRVDQAGQELVGQWRSITFTFEAAAVPAVAQLLLANDTGTSATDLTTSDPTVVGCLIGPGNRAFADVQFDEDGIAETIEGYAKTDADGNFSYLPAGLVAGAQTVRARVTLWDDDQAAYRSGDWKALSFALEAVAAPTLEVGSLALIEDTGDDPDDLVTAKPAFSGQVSCAAGVGYLLVEMDLNDDESADASVSTDAYGRFSFRPQGLALAEVTVQARARRWDHAANAYVYSPWTPFSFTLAADETPVVTTLALQSDTGTSPTDLVTANPLLIGQISNSHGLSGLTVEIDENHDGVADGATLTDGDGQFHYRPETLVYGPACPQARAKQWDPLANAFVVGAWTEIGFTLESQPASAPLVMDLRLAADTGASSTDGVTCNPTLAGKINTQFDPVLVGIDVHFDDGPADQSVGADAFGRFSLAPGGLDYGTVNAHARARVIDPTTGEILLGPWSSLTFTYQAAANAVPVVAEYGLANDNGALPDDHVTTDARLEGSVTDDVSGAGLEVQFDYGTDGVIDGATTTDSEGHFSFLPGGTAIVPGPLSIRMRIKEPVADAVPQYTAWQTLSFTLEPTASTLPQVSQLWLDAGGSGWQATNNPQLTGRVTGPGSLAGTTVLFDVDGNGVGDDRVVTDANGYFSYSPKNLVEGPVTIEARTMVPTTTGSVEGTGQTVKLVFYSTALSATEAGEIATSLGSHDAGFQTAATAYSAAVQAAQVNLAQANQTALTTTEQSLAGANQSFATAMAGAAEDAQDGMSGALAALNAALATAATNFAGNLANFTGDKTSYQAPDFRWPAAPASSGFRYPGTNELPQPDQQSPLYAGAQFDLEADPAYKAAVQQAVTAFQNRVRQLEQELKTEKAAAELELKTNQGSAYGRHGTSMRQAWSEYQEALAQPVGNPVDMVAEAKAHQARIDQAQKDYVAEIAQHLADYNAAAQDASAAYQQEIQPVADPNSPDWPAYQQRVAAASANLARKLELARRKQEQRDIESKLDRVQKCTESSRILSDKQSEHDTFLKKWKVDREHQYKTQAAAAEKTLSEELATAKQTMTDRVATALKGYSVNLAAAQNTLRQGRLDAALGAVTTWADQTNTPWSTYQKAILQNEVNYVAAVAPRYLQYVTDTAEALRKQRSDFAQAAKTRSDKSAVAVRDSTVEKSTAENDFLKDCQDNAHTRAKSTHLADRDREDGMADAQATYEKLVVAADSTWRLGEWAASAARESAIVAAQALMSAAAWGYYWDEVYAGNNPVNPEILYNAAVAAANEAYQHTMRPIDWEHARADIGALEARARIITKADKDCRIAIYQAEKTWTCDNADDSLEHETDLAAADRKYTRAAAKAFTDEIKSQATAGRERAGTVAEKWQGFADFSTTQANTYDQLDAGAWKTFVTTTAGDYQAQVASWRSSRSSTWNDNQKAWADYLVGLASAEVTRVNDTGSAVVGDSGTVGSSAVQTIQTENAADKTFDQAAADAEAGSNGWITTIVGAQLDYAQQVADRRFEHASAVAQRTTEHDKAVAEANRAYYCALATEDEARQNGWDAAEWRYRREEHARYEAYAHEEIDGTQSNQRYQANLLNRRKDQADTDQKFSINIAVARQQYVQQAGDKHATYAAQLGGAANALAYGIYAQAVDLAGDFQGADVAYADRVYGAAETQSHDYANAECDLTGDIAAADASWSNSLNQVSSGFRESASSVRLTLDQEFVDNYAGALEAEVNADPTSRRATYESALAQGQKTWIQSLGPATTSLQTRLTTAYNTLTGTINAASQSTTTQIAGLDKGYSLGMASALKAQGTGWENALAQAGAKIDKAAAEKTATQSIAQAAYDTALANALRDHNNRVAAADVEWAKRVAPARASAYINGDTQEALATFNTAKEQADWVKSRGQSISMERYSRDVGAAKIAQATALGNAEATLATKTGDASIAATTAINTVETTFASSYAGGVNGRTTGTSPLTTGLLSQLASAGRAVSTALNSAVTSTIADLGAANVTLARDSAQAEADFHAIVASDQHAALAASAGATAPSTQLALARKNWLSGMKSAFVSHAQGQAQADATFDNHLATAAATASQARLQADEMLLQASLGPMQTYWNGTVADQMTYYQGSVERENAWHLGQAAADKAQSVTQANATRDFMVGMYTADGDYQSAYHQADADYYNSRLDANPDAETQRSTAQMAAETQRTQSRGSTLVGYVTGEMGAKVGFTQASTSGTAGYLSGESAGVRTLRSSLAEREYAFSTALVQPTSIQQAVYAGADVAYFTSARAASNAHDLSDADAWTSFHAADYSARVSASGTLSSGLGIPWASFQYTSALAESQWWLQQRSAYRDLTIAANQEHDLYQQRVNAAYTSMRSAQALADSALDVTSASLSRWRALSEAAADDQYVQSLAPAASAYQVAYAQAHQAYAIQQAQAEAGQGPENPTSPNTGLAHGAYAAAEVSATGARRLGLATAEQAYRDASGAADVTWTTAYADSERNFLLGESDAHRDRQSALGTLLWNYRAAEAQSYSSALSAYATTYDNPWAHLAAEQAQVKATYTSSVAICQKALLADQAAAKYDLEAAEANADRQHAIDLANARAASEHNLGLAAVNQATAQTTTDNSQLAAGQYRPTLPEWTSNVQLYSTRPEFNDAGAAYNRPPVDGMAAGVVGKMFYAIAAQTELPENYWDEWNYHLYYGFSGHYPGNYLREGVLRPLPPQVTLDDAATPEATLGADAAKQVSQTAALTRPAAQKKPRSGWQTTGDLGAGSSAAVSAEVQQFMELAAVCPEAASQLAPSVVFTDPMQNGCVTINQDSSGRTFSTGATSDPEAQTRLAGAVMSAGLSEPGWQLDPGLDDSPIRDLVGSYTDSSAGQVVPVPAAARPEAPSRNWMLLSASSDDDPDGEGLKRPMPAASAIERAEAIRLLTEAMKDKTKRTRIAPSDLHKGRVSCITGKPADSCNRPETWEDRLFMATMLGGFMIFGSTVPGAGEAMDVATICDPQSKWWERTLSFVSLGANVLAVGFLPNFGALSRAGRSIGNTSDEVIDSVAHGAHALDGAADVTQASASGANRIYSAGRTSSEVREIAKKAATIKEVRRKLGRAGLINSSLVRIVRAAASELPEARYGMRHFGWISIEFGRLLKDHRGRFIIKLTDDALASLEKAVHTVGHELHHIKETLAGIPGLSQSEAAADAAGDVFLKEFLKWFSRGG